MNRRKTLAICMVISLIFGICQSFAQTAEELLPKGIQLEEVKGELEKAIEVYLTIVTKFSADRPIAAKALLHIGLCNEKLGKQEAQKAYLRIIQEFADQTEMVTQARARLTAMDQLVKETGTSGVVVRQVWSQALYDMMGSPSPDGRYFSYANWDNGNLGVHNVETNENRDITSEGSWKNPTQWAEHSIWSPDSRQLAYRWYTPENKYHLRIVGLDGSKPRILYQNTDVGPYPQDWSNDGKSVLVGFRTVDNTYDIALVTVADGSVRVLKSLPLTREFISMSLSPNGRYVIYDFPQNADTQKRDIILVDANDGHEVALVEHPEDDGSPFWTSDGKRIVFISDRTGTKGLWVLDVIEGKPQGSPVLIRDNLENIEPIRLNRKGSFYYTCGGLGRGDLFVASIDPKTGKIQSSPKKAVRSFEGYNSQPAWSPDGKYLAYVSERPHMQLNIAVISVETGEERVLPCKNSIYLPSIHTPLRWSPDSSSILVRTRDVKGQLILYSVDVQNGEYTPIVEREIKSWSSPVWSPNGKQIYYQDVQAGRSPVPGPIEVRDLEAGVDKELFKGVWFLSLSPDGSQIAFASPIIVDKEWSIQVMPASGGKAREILHLKDLKELWLLFGSTWTPDSRYLLFYKRKGEIHELWRISAEGGTPEKLGLEMKGLSHVCIHPDGRRIAFGSVSETPLEVWAIDNFLQE